MRRLDTNSLTLYGKSVMLLLALTSCANGWDSPPDGNLMRDVELGLARADGDADNALCAELNRLVKLPPRPNPQTVYSREKRNSSYAVS